MKSMGGDYYWPHSVNEADNAPGVLILAHGYGEEGDADLYNSLEDFSETYQTTVAYGMSMMSSRHIECSLLEMNQAGSGKTYIVPVSASPFNTLVRQWRYIFNLENDYSYANVEKVNSDGAVFLEPIGDHPLAREIVLDFANEISSDPSNEVVLIVAHGPVSGEDNALQLEMMDNISSYLSANGGFSEVMPLTLQDDAPPEVRAANVQRMREFVSTRSYNGRDVLIVSNLMSGKGIQRRVERDLEGLTYSFNPNGVATHPLFREWIEVSIQESLGKNQMD
jgi:sirohydrochlorin cobaltochelatase